MQLNYYKRRRALKYTPQQLEQILWKCRKLRREATNTDTSIIVDDEKYFSFPGDNIPSNAGFCSTDRANASVNVKLKQKQKFAPKVLVWLAISSKGVSALYIGSTKGPALNGDLYLRECLSKLLEFIEEHHVNDKYIP